jgi:hypothetical protein
MVVIWMLEIWWVAPVLLQIDVLTERASDNMRNWRRLHGKVKSAPCVILAVIASKIVSAVKRCDGARRSVEEFESGAELVHFLQEAASDRKYCRHKDLSLGIVDAAKKGEQISSLPQAEDGREDELLIKMAGYVGIHIPSSACLDGILNPEYEPSLPPYLKMPHYQAACKHLMFVTSHVGACVLNVLSQYNQVRPHACLLQVCASRAHGAQLVQPERGTKESADSH